MVLLSDFAGVCLGVVLSQCLAAAPLALKQAPGGIAAFSSAVGAFLHWRQLEPVFTGRFCSQDSCGRANFMSVTLDFDEQALATLPFEAGRTQARPPAMILTLPENLEARLSPQSTALHLAIGLFASDECTLGQAGQDRLRLGKME